MCKNDISGNLLVPDGALLSKGDFVILELKAIKNIVCGILLHDVKLDLDLPTVFDIEILHGIPGFQSEGTFSTKFWNVMALPQGSEEYESLLIYLARRALMKASNGHDGEHPTPSIQAKSLDVYSIKKQAIIEFTKALQKPLLIHSRSHQEVLALAIGMYDIDITEVTNLDSIARLDDSALASLVRYRLSKSNSKSFL